MRSQPVSQRLPVIAPTRVTPGQAVIAPVLSSSSNVLHTAASAAPIAAPRTASSSRVSTTSRPVVSKTVGKSKKSASSGYSSALISAAFQEQFMRDLRLDFRSNNTSSSTADRLGLHMHDILVHAQQVSDHVGPQSQLRTALNATEWAHARAKSLQRGDSEAPCAICHANFETSAQVLLSCSHTFHAACITSFERFTGTRCCPLCRHSPYERIAIDDGLVAYRLQCAVKLQSWWRGISARRVFLRDRDLAAPMDPLLRRRYFSRKLERVGREINQIVDENDASIDALFAEIDGNLSISRAAMSGVFEETASAADDVKWIECRRLADQRGDTECPICMVECRGARKPLVLTSCSHVFHSACLESFERFNECNQREVQCPMCRSSYDKTSYK